MAWSAGAILTAAQLNTYVPQAWTSYAPTLGGTGTTQGNATMTGGYIQRGPTVEFWAKATLGSTSVIGSAIQLALPLNGVNADQHAGLYGKFLDIGSNTYMAFPLLVSIGAIGLVVPGTNGASVAVSSTVPFTWATGDIIMAGGTYQA